MTSHHAFVTGATGFIGSNLVVELLRNGRQLVFCLVRPRGDVHTRLVDAVTSAAEAAGLIDEIRPHLDRLVAVGGDLGLDGLALDAGARAGLAAQPIHECWHAAASLRYEDRHRDEILATNVEGTRHVLESAARLGIAEFHHISTAYVAGTRTGDVPEEPYDPTFVANNWYEVSKRRGEDLAVAGADRFDRLRILRPSIVIGNAATSRSTSTSGYYGFLRGLDTFCRLAERERPGHLATHGVKLFVEPASSLDLVPVDLLVAEAVAPSTTDDRYLHLTNPFPVPLERARVGPEGSIRGLRLDLVADRARLGDLDLLLDDALDFYRPYLRNDKRFERRRDGGTPPPAMHLSDEALVALSRSHLEDHRRATVSDP